MSRITELFSSPIEVVNMGLESFYEAVMAQGSAACQVDWKPPAGGDMELIELLDRLDRLPDDGQMDAGRSAEGGPDEQN